MPHGRHIYYKAYYIEKSTMSAYPHSDHALQNLKYLLRCCDKCPCINISDQETDYHYYDTISSNQFHIYHLILHCTAHGRILLNDRKMCPVFKQDFASE